MHWRAFDNRHNFFTISNQLLIFFVDVITNNKWKTKFLVVRDIRAEANFLLLLDLSVTYFQAMWARRSLHRGTMDVIVNG